MNRRSFVVGGAAFAAAVIANIRNTNPVRAEASAYGPELVIDYDENGRIRSIGSAIGKRWGYMGVNENASQHDRDNSLVYDLSYGYLDQDGNHDKTRKVEETDMIFGIPRHETVDSFNDRVVDFFKWSFDYFGLINIRVKNTDDKHFKLERLAVVDTARHDFLLVAYHIPKGSHTVTHAHSERLFVSDELIKRSGVLHVNALLERKFEHFIARVNAMPQSEYVYELDKLR